MSGGHFDYAQYRIDDIIGSIERQIEQATCERPPLVTEHGVFVKLKIEEGHYCYPSWHDYRTFEQAEKYFRDYGYREIDRRTLDNGERELTVKDPASGDEYIVGTYTSQHYAPDEDGNIPYFPDWSEETIREFRNAIAILKRASIYVQRIDWLICGDYGEETFHKRLKTELLKLKIEEEEK